MCIVMLIDKYVKNSSVNGKMHAMYSVLKF